MKTTSVNASSIRTLKHIALLGGISGYAEVSSRELGKILGESQQSASKRILDLSGEGYIQRDMGRRSQKLRLTGKAVELLRREYSDYLQVFTKVDRVVVHGSIVSGMGEGKYYVTLPEYKRQFTEKLGFKPYEGTLNISIESGDLSNVHILKEREGVVVRGFEADGRTFGEVQCFRAAISGNNCAVILPARTHYLTVIEIISKKNLRKALGAGDGSNVEVEILL